MTRKVRQFGVFFEVKLDRNRRAIKIHDFKVKVHFVGVIFIKVCTNIKVIEQQEKINL